MLSIKKITQLAKENSTPLYIFDKDELADRISSIKSIVGDGVTICYAMKANPFLLDAAKKLNVKFEVCSPGEFSICERENINMSDIVLSGVNKEKHDIEHVMDDCGGVGIFWICHNILLLYINVILQFLVPAGLESAIQTRFTCLSDSYDNRTLVPLPSLLAIFKRFN